VRNPSISVAQALLAGGIVDDSRLVIAPSIAGGGRRILDGLPSIQLESIRSEISRLAICSSTIALFVNAALARSTAKSPPAG
jgi:riboflavin biosynthesis pyrimidine reductase